MQVGAAAIVSSVSLQVGAATRQGKREVGAAQVDQADEVVQVAKAISQLYCDFDD